MPQADLRDCKMRASAYQCSSAGLDGWECPCLSSHSTCLAMTNQWRAICSNVSLISLVLDCVARRCATFPRRRYSSAQVSMLSLRRITTRLGGSMFRGLVGLHDGQPRRWRGFPGLARPAPNLSSRPAHLGLSDFIVESRACAFEFGQCCVQPFPRSVQFFMREIDDLGHRVALSQTMRCLQFRFRYSSSLFSVVPPCFKR